MSARYEPLAATLADLWQCAENAGLSRRAFLRLLATGGVAAVLAACQAPAPAATPTTAAGTPTPAAAAASPTAGAAVQTTPTARPRGIVKSTPPTIFIDHGLNQETRLEAVETYQTPSSHFYIRNHSATPQIDAASYRLRIEGAGVNQPFELTLDDLKGMPAATQTVWVECAGNARTFFREVLNRPAEGTQWRFGAIGNAEWKGTRLANVLERGGVKSSAKSVLIEGLDQTKVRRPIPLDKAMDQQTILAYEMNGQPLPPDHGFPVRAITPGWVGINNIKWVGRIEVLEQEFQDVKVPTMTETYVLDTGDPVSKPPVTLQTIKSAIALPWPAALPAGRQTIRGFAWSPEARIAKVEYRVDDAQAWQSAQLRGPNVQYAWVQWSFDWDATPGSHAIRTRATDEKGNVQPEQFTWNRLGYLWNAIVAHSVTVA